VLVLAACDSVGVRRPVRALRNPGETCYDEDKHKAPALPHIHPLSLQDAGDAGDAGVPIIPAIMTLPQ
jgi:hypothetical protein